MKVKLEYNCVSLIYRIRLNHTLGNIRKRSPPWGGEQGGGQLTAMCRWDLDIYIKIYINLTGVSITPGQKTPRQILKTPRHQDKKLYIN